MQSFPGMSSPQVFDSICKQWRSRLDTSHEYSVIQNDSIFRANLADSCVLESEYQQVRKLRKRLIKEYEGIPLEEALPGEEICSPEGDCYCIRGSAGIEFHRPDNARIMNRLENDFTLIYGIGEKTERSLKRRGYQTIHDLVHHRRFGRGASEYLERLANLHPYDISLLISRWHSPSHFLNILSSGLYQDTDFVFLDLETLGFFSRPIILFGIAEVSAGALKISQYLLRDISEEFGALQVIKKHLDENRVLVTYNGKSFDIPYLRERFAFYGDINRVAHPHYDLLHFARRKWKDSFPDCSLQTIEKNLFQVARSEDVPGAMIPEFYECYLKTGNPGPLVPIVVHNRQDLISLVRLFCLLREISYDCC